MNENTNSLAEIQELSPEHFKMLIKGSGISEEMIAACGYRTITDARELEKLHFAPSQRRVPGLLLPVHCTDSSNSLYVYRPDNPRETWSGKGNGYKHKTLKYEIPKSARMRLDCPPICRPQLANPQIPLWITEGQKKADALASRRQCAVALLGVWNFKGKNPFHGTTFLVDWDFIALDNREVRIVFDSDVMTKPQVRQALDRLKEHLQRKGARVGIVYLPKSEIGKCGVDDFLTSGCTIDDLLKLLEAPRPLLQPAAPLVELLDSAPPTMRRPLALINGCAYAAIWPYVKVTQTEKLQKDGTIVRFNPPKVTNERRLFIVRDDGKIFGDGNGCEPMANLGLEAHLPEIPPDEKLWSPAGVRAYRAGKRPNPVDVFMKLGTIIDKFIDFDKSLAEQATMVEMVVCFVFTTWFLDAFVVIGYLWANGDSGAGKTNFLSMVVELAYLGMLILAGGSYASLRDLADYGATLGFDDAENLADPKNLDPDKRTLLLAGNRRGNVVPMKEIGPDKMWRTRYVYTFCARLFSAIRLPDPVLSNRSIIVPLVRTADRKRGNAVLLDHETWPYNRRELIDDLWAMALYYLVEMPKYERQVRERASLSGRSLEPWRSLLAVALFLEEKGIDGLFQRMDELSMDYQNERSDLDANNLMILVIQGLCHCAISSICAISGETPTEWEIETQQVTEAVLELVKNGEIDIDEKRINNRNVGRILARLRLAEIPRPGGKGSRKRRLTLSDLQSFAVSYALKLPDTLLVNGTNGTNGTMAQQSAPVTETIEKNEVADRF